MHFRTKHSVETTIDFVIVWLSWSFSHLSSSPAFGRGSNPRRDGRNCVFGLFKYCLYWPCHYGWERFEFWCWIASNSPWLWSMMCSNCRICYLCYKYNAYDWEGVVLDRKLLLSEKWTSMPSNFENKVYNYAIFTIAFSFFQKPSFLLFYLF